MTDREKLIVLLCEAMLIYDRIMDDRQDNPFHVFADHLLANGVTFHKWIPVSERLPDKEEKYLVAGAWRGEPVQTWICEFYDSGSVQGWCNSGRNPVVTHWMPLPEPPKEEDK